MNKKNDFTWEDYHKKTDLQTPRPLLLKTLSLIPSQKNMRAVDLGCGNGRDTRHLLQQGWKVTAVEKEFSGIEILKKNLNPDELKNLDLIHSGFEELTTLPHADLVHASFSLPFCKKEFFPTLWKLIGGSLQKNSFFAGQFFGPDDEWIKGANPLTGHSKQETESLFAGYKIIQLSERNEKGPTAAGPLKHWHIFEVIAQKTT